jgi:thymidylate synthase
VSRLTRASSKMTAQATGYEPGDFVHTLGDAHLYKNRLEQTASSAPGNRGRFPGCVSTPR